MIYNSSIGSTFNYWLFLCSFGVLLLLLLLLMFLWGVFFGGLVLSCFVWFCFVDTTMPASEKITRAITPYYLLSLYDYLIKWKHFPRYYPFLPGIQRSPVNSPHKGHWRGALIFSLICAWIKGWVNTREAGDLRRHRAHYDVIVMMNPLFKLYLNAKDQVSFFAKSKKIDMAVLKFSKGNSDDRTAKNERVPHTGCHISLKVWIIDRTLIKMI